MSVYCFWCLIATWQPLFNKPLWPWYISVSSSKYATHTDFVTHVNKSMPNDLILLHCIIKYVFKNRYKLEEFAFPWTKLPAVVQCFDRRVWEIFKQVRRVAKQPFSLHWKQHEHERSIFDSARNEFFHHPPTSRTSWCA